MPALPTRKYYYHYYHNMKQMTLLVASDVSFITTNMTITVLPDSDRPGFDSESGCGSVSRGSHTTDFKTGTPESGCGSVSRRSHTTNFKTGTPESGCGSVSRGSHTTDFKTGTPAPTLPGACSHNCVCCHTEIAVADHTFFVSISPSHIILTLSSQSQR